MANEFRVKHGLATSSTVVINASGNWVGQPIPNNKLVNDGISINGQRVNLGSSITVDSFPVQEGAAGKFLKSNGTSTYWADIDGEKWTADAAPPATGNEVGDKWYDTTNQVLYEYISDGTSTYWLDVQGPTVALPPASTYQTRIYVGDGENNSFAVTSGCTVDSVLVFLNGICKEPAVDYTILGASLTFSSAPSQGVRIQIRELPR